MSKKRKFPTETQPSLGPELDPALFGQPGAEKEEKHPLHPLHPLRPLLLRRFAEILRAEDKLFEPTLRSRNAGRRLGCFAQIGDEAQPLTAC